MCVFWYATNRQDKIRWAVLGAMNNFVKEKQKPLASRHALRSVNSFRYDTVMLNLIFL
jgi:hypothetical protein